MSSFLLLLIHVNLAMGAAIVLVSVLRRPLRAQFGAPIAYSVWFLVPIAGIGSLVPPRVAAPVPALASIASLVPPRVAAPVPAPIMQAPVELISTTSHIAHSALRVKEHLTEHSALVLTVPPSASAYAMPNTTLLLFVVWALGAMLMTLYLTRLQLRFYASVRLGEAGPAVLGFLRPRIVTPDSFQKRFTPQEQAAILAHENVHLARQDARTNALAASLRCLCWFNPLIHLGARWLRIDQELACDATTVAGAISRRDYARALLKSQMMFIALPLGCNWPGSQHPLIERVALLKRKPPGAARRLVGIGLVMMAAASAGLGAWAAQPPVAAKSMTTQAASTVSARLSAMVAAPGQISGVVGPYPPVAHTTPTSSDNGIDALKKVRADSAISPPPVPETPGTISIDALMHSVLAALPQMNLAPEPKIIADQFPTGQGATSAPNETSAKNTVTAPATGDDPAAGAASVTATEPVLIPNTPSGTGDPNATGNSVPAKEMQLASLPTLLSLVRPAGDAPADTCSLTLLNSVPLTITDNVASVPASIGTKEKQFQIDTAAPDNQMRKDALTDFGLTATNFAPAQITGGAGSFSLGQAAGTFVDGRAIGITQYGPVSGLTSDNAVAIYNAKGTMFRSRADAGTFTLGSMRTDHLQFVVTDLPEPGSGGILSAGFFRHYDIDLNFWAHRFNMFAPDHCKGQVLYWRAPGVAMLPFRFQNGRIIVRVSVDAREMDAAIDTGSPRSEMQFDDADSLFYKNSLSNGMMREDDGLYAYDFSDLSFGSVLIYHPHLVLTHSELLRGTNSGPQTGTLLRNVDHASTQPSLVIGTDLLKLLHLYIAFNERMVYVTQGPELPKGDARALPMVKVTPFRP